MYSDNYISYFAMKICCWYSLELPLIRILVRTHYNVSCGETSKISILIPLKKVSYYTLLQTRVGIRIIFLIFLLENICCGYLLEGPQLLMNTHKMFLWRNKKTVSTFRLKKVPYLDLSSLSL